MLTNLGDEVVLVDDELFGKILEVDMYHAGPQGDKTVDDSRKVDEP